MGILLFFAIGGAVFLFSLAVRFKLLRTYEKWSRVRSVAGRPGAQVARIILDENALVSVELEPLQGKLKDHYDPRAKKIRLSRDNFFGNSIAAVAIAAHECGHAIQDATGYGPMRFRSVMTPLANLGARFGVPLAIIGSLVGSERMVQVGMLGYAAALLLTFVTLPVEFNASKRALAELQRLHLVSDDGLDAAKEVLRAAAMTYVAGVATSAGYIVYLVILGGRALVFSPKPPPTLPPP